MKLEIRMFLREDLEKVLRKNRYIENNFDIENAAYNWVDGEAEVVARVIELSANTSGMHVFTMVELSNKELKEIAYFEVSARSMLKLPDFAQKKNDEYMECQPFVQTSDETKIKFRRRIYLGAKLPKPNMIACTEYNEGYMCSSDVSNIFLVGGLTGYKEYPVYSAKSGEVIDGYSLIGAENVLPPLEEDITIITMDNSPPNDIYYNRRGLTSYAANAFDQFCDFNLTAESYSENDSGLLVVSSTVKNICKEQRIKGIAFLPILDRSTELYNEYIDRFSKFQKRLSVNSENSMS